MATWERLKGTPADDLRTADELRRHVKMARPDWPGPEDRAEDLRNHLRVSEAISAIAFRPR